MKRRIISGEKVFFVTTSDGQNVYLVSSTQVANELALLASELPNDKKTLIRFSKDIDAEVAAEIRGIVSNHSTKMEILEGLDQLEQVDRSQEEAAGRPWSPSLKWIAIPTVALILLAATIWKAKSPLIGSLFTIEKVVVQKVVENLEVQKAFSYC